MKRTMDEMVEAIFAGLEPGESISLSKLQTKLKTNYDSLLTYIRLFVDIQKRPLLKYDKDRNTVRLVKALPHPKISFQFFEDHVIETELDPRVAEALAILCYRSWGNPARSFKDFCEWWLPQNKAVRDTLEIVMEENQVTAHEVRQHYERMKRLCAKKIEVNTDG